jgi:hypothetical protein
MSKNKHMKRIIFLSIVALVIFVSCIDKNYKVVSSTTTVGYELPDLFIPTDSKQFYFPTDFDNFRNEWYSKHLFAMREPILFSDSSQTESYRFVWLRTFHNPIAIRIEKQQNIYLLTWKQCNGEGGYEPGQLTIAKQKQINDVTWENFKKLLNQIDFWNMSTEIESEGFDGSQWILEGKVVGKYHVVDRWTPRDGAYYKCCDFLIGLTDLVIDKKKKY